MSPADVSPDEIGARLALHQLVADYCHELDTTAGLRATELMTPDCRMEMGAMQLSGHAEIQRFYEVFAQQVRTAVEGGIRTTRHVATNLRIMLDESNEAQLDFIVLNFSAPGQPPLHGGTVPTIVSDVRLVCQKELDGRWRISGLSGGPVFIGDDPIQNTALLNQDNDGVSNGRTGSGS